jgi:hypothetical protein
MKCRVWGYTKPETSRRTFRLVAPDFVAPIVLAAVGKPANCISAYFDDIANSSGQSWHGDCDSL